jgi:hypothetical protein
MQIMYRWLKLMPLLLQPEPMKPPSNPSAGWESEQRPGYELVTWPTANWVSGAPHKDLN